MIQADSI